MYLRGLSDVNSDMQAQLCMKNGGIPSFYYPWLRADGTPDTSRASYNGCDYPYRGEAPSGGGQPINVSVPTTVNTVVSPQVSPQFIQQEHPTNSGIDAGVVSRDSGGLQTNADSQSILDLLKEALKPAPAAEPMYMTAPLAAEGEASITPAAGLSPLIIAAGILGIAFLIKDK